jgi:hypothetical protein
VIRSFIDIDTIIDAGLDTIILLHIKKIWTWTIITSSYNVRYKKDLLSNSEKVAVEQIYRQLNTKQSDEQTARDIKLVLSDKRYA